MPNPASKFLKAATTAAGVTPGSGRTSMDLKVHVPTPGQESPAHEEKPKPRPKPGKSETANKLANLLTSLAPGSNPNAEERGKSVVLRVDGNLHEWLKEKADRMREDDPSCAASVASLVRQAVETDITSEEGLQNSRKFVGAQIRKNGEKQVSLFLTLERRNYLEVWVGRINGGHNRISMTGLATILIYSWAIEQGFEVQP